MTIESSVKTRYAAAAHASEKALCCPIDYNPKFLEAIPSEVIERDYGCGDPSKHVREGETVLDLGSGTGKICFIASQVVGKSGKVIGVDMTDDMLDVARRNAPVVADNIGYANVEFRKGRIQDLALDMEKLEQHLATNPITDANGYMEIDQIIDGLRKSDPLVADDSVDVVVSNCVLNLVDDRLKKQMFSEIFRVLKRGGRAVISDIVSDEPAPEHMRNNPHLWSGCISGAMTEAGFLAAFEEAGFYGINILKLDQTPWQTVEGIEFRSMTIEAHKGKEGPCMDRNQAVIYKGPFKSVLDDDGHRLDRGERMAVCEKTFHIYCSEPYRQYFDFVEPLEEVAAADASEFDCRRNARRHPRETKGRDYDATIDNTGSLDTSNDLSAGSNCGPSCC